VKKEAKENYNIDFVKQEPSEGTLCGHELFCFYCFLS